MKVRIFLSLSVPLLLAGCSATPEEMAALSQQLNAMSQSYQQYGQQMLIQSSGYQAPAVNSYTQPRGHVFCHQTGYVINCR